MCKNLKRRSVTSSNTGNLFGAWSKFGFKPIISLLVVFSLGLSPLLAIPGKAGLFQRTTLTLPSSSQTQSLESSANLNSNQEMSSQTLEENLLKAKDTSTSALAKLDVVDSQMATQMDLTKVLQESQSLTLKVNENLTVDNAALEKKVSKQEGIIEELRGNKLKKILEVGGTYNTTNGWGLGADVGLKYGNVTTKFGAEALVADLINPVKIKDLDTYTFKASVGLEW